MAQANIVSPAGLRFVSNLGSQIVENTDPSKTNEVTVLRPNGYTVIYSMGTDGIGIPIGRQQNFSSKLESLTIEGQEMYDRTFSNGSRAN